MFLDFVDTFNKALEPSPWINALNLAGFAGSAMPEPASMLFGFGVEYATEAALEGHSRYSSNTFLDRVNTQYFNPRGLVCLVVTWQPGISGNQLTVNFEGDATASRSEPGISERIADVATQKTSAKEGWQGMKNQMGKMMKLSNGNFDWPEPAPLVFPATDDVTGSESDSGAKKKNALDRMEIWMEDMSDKRAQAKWVDENSDKSAASLMPNHEFRSRYADPNHPAASGDIVALVTGGRWMYADKKHIEGCTTDSKSKKNENGEKSGKEKDEKKHKKDKKEEKDKCDEKLDQDTDSERPPKDDDDKDDKKSKKDKDKKSKKAESKDERNSSAKDEDWLKSLFHKVTNVLQFTQQEC
ncbi:FAD binding domain-containing protein [Colletotrichum incanum]|nr:FAD binding domain-containing protein [Colletotrichum incanum]